MKLNKLKREIIIDIVALVTIALVFTILSEFTKAGGEIETVIVEDHSIPTLKTTP